MKTGIFNQLRFGRQISKLKNSIFFNSSWYLEKYPDVRAAGIDPALHYLLHGAKEQRDPGPLFSTTAYKARHPELTKSNENPLIHFLDSGQHQPNKPLNYLPSSLVNPDRDRSLNIIQAAKDEGQVSESEQAIKDFRSKLPNPRDFDGIDRVPKLLHFIFGFQSTGDLPFYGYIAIRTALHFNPGWSAFYYCMHEPAGPNWDRIKSKLTLIKIKDFQDIYV